MGLPLQVGLSYIGIPVPIVARVDKCKLAGNIVDIK